MKDKEETSELEEEVVKEIESENLKEISNEINGNQFQDFLIRDIPVASLEQIQNVSQQIDLEQDFSPRTETQEPREMYGSVTQEERRLYESQARTIEPATLTSNRRATQQANFIDPLAGMNIPIQDSMQPEMIRTQTEHKRQRLPFEKEDDKYKEVKL